MRVIPAKTGIHPLPGDVDPRLRGGDEVILCPRMGHRPMETPLKARAKRAKSGWVNFSRRLSRRTRLKKYRSERKGRRSFDTALEYGTVAIIGTEKTRTAESAVRATCSGLVEDPLFVEHSH
jgi:hypothetical protein